MTKRISRAGHSEIRGEAGELIAIVSGKGGSGKTMIAVALAQGAALAGQKVMLVDADFATGGLTYYLTFREFVNSRIGLSDRFKIVDGLTANDWAASGDSQEYASEWLENIRLLPIGDQRKFHLHSDAEIMELMSTVMNEAKEHSDLVIVDCRGGIDSQSLAICQMVDEIVVVVETDTTSIRSSQHLVDLLAESGLNKKVSGFILNKVMDDPTSLAKTASSLLGIKFLGAIPFDIEATRSYIQGRIPERTTLFSRQVFSTIPKIIDGIGIFDHIRTLDPEEFGSVTLRSPEIRVGGVFISAMALYLSFGYIYYLYSTTYTSRFWDRSSIELIALAVGNLLVLSALSDPIKQGFGRLFRVYTKALPILFRKIVS